jgi:hypothetical protein
LPPLIKYIIKITRIYGCFVSNLVCILLKAKKEMNSGTYTNIKCHLTISKSI